MDVTNNLPNVPKYQILVFTCKNAMVDLIEMLHFEIKKVEKQNVVRFWVKAFLSDTEAKFPGQGEAAKVLWGCVGKHRGPRQGKALDGDRVLLLS